MPAPSPDPLPEEAASVISPASPRRKRRSSSRRSRRKSSAVAEGLKRRKRPLSRRLKGAWKKYRRLVRYSFLALTGLALFVATMVLLFKLNTRTEIPKTTLLDAPDTPSASQRNRGFSLSNLTKLDLAGERSAYGRSLKLGESTLSNKEILADTAFRGGQYAEAETLYRELLPGARRRSVVTYHLFLCILMQGRVDEAEKIFPADGQPSPAWFYSRAALEFQKGNEAEAHALLKEAKFNYPAFVSLYDPALRTLGFLP